MAFTLIRINHVHPDPVDGTEMSDRYRAALDIAEFLDERGLNAVQLDEHHVSSTGWSPTPMMTAGMIVSRTEHVLCLIGALLLPLHDPIRVAEDLAVLDLVSKGRIVVTVGLGYRPVEYAAMARNGPNGAASSTRASTSCSERGPESRSSTTARWCRSCRSRSVNRTQPS